VKSVPRQDIRTRPAYSAADAARFLRLPVSTVRAWSFGQRYAVAGDSRRFKPVISVADPARRFLSFLNLVELLVLAAIRRTHKVPLGKVRKAVDYLRKNLTTDHPLADHQFLTNGVDLFVEHYGKILNLSRNGQIEIRDMIVAYLKLVDRDDQGIPIRLHLPKVASIDAQPAPSAIVIDPRFGFGRPVIEGSGVRIDVMVERFNSGEGIVELAADYGLTDAAIEDAIRMDSRRAA
jgi:uncharacterized protein (DUF433 family)